MKKNRYINKITNTIIIVFVICIGQTTVVLQEGLNGYNGCEDAYLQIDNGGYGNWDFLTFEECPS